MVENKENNDNGRFDVSSKFVRVFLVIVSAFLIFAGPTYVSYALYSILNVNRFASAGAGFALFTAGLLLMLFLIRKKIIS